MIRFTSVIFFFLLTANTLIPFPIDKVMIFVGLLYAVFAKDSNVPNLNVKYLLIAAAIICIAIVGGIINQDFDGMLYYPVIGVLFISLFKKEEKLEAGLYYGLLLHIILALILYITSYYSLNPYVRGMAEKGAPFLHASLGFTPTNQTFGTYCILWLIIYFFRKEQIGKQSKIHKLYYFLVMVAILTTLNRSTFIFTLLVIFFKDFRLFSGILILATSIFILFFKEISGFLLNSATIDARSDLLEGFNLSFWGSKSYLVYIFGRGSVFINDRIAEGTTWSFRKDIENGYAFLLHGYGFLGLGIYLAIASTTTFFLLVRRYFFEAIVVFFYMFLSLYFTQELVSNSFYLFIVFIFYKTSKKAYVESSSF